MNEASGAGEKGDAPPTLTTDASATADTKATSAEGETPVKEQSSVENEAKEAESVAGEVTDEAAGEPMNVDKAKSPTQPTQAVETKEVEGGVESTSPEPTPGSSSAPDDPLASRLAKVVKSGSKSAADTSSTPESVPKDASESALSTKTLLSVLEDSFDKEQTDVAEDAAKSQPQAAASQESTPASQSVSESSQSVSESSTSQPVPESSTSQSAPGTQQSLTDLPPPKMNRKYIYKLKSKTGKVLKYVSSVPIVLKRPVISLTKMEEEEESDTTEEEKTEATGKAARTEAEDVDSDNSTKENNVKANDASKGVAGPRIARKRGRPPLLQKAPVITLDDSPSPDPVTEAKEPFKSVASGSSTPSYGVQTRKRQLKFLPDGRVVTPAGKKYKSAAAAAAAAVAAAASSSKALEESSDTDVLTESDDGSQSDRKTKKLPVATKKVTPVDRKVLEKKGSAKKVFDYESCFRENSTPEAKDAKQSVPAKKVVETPKSTPKPVNPPRSTPVTTKAAATPTNNSATSTPTPKNTVDPAQLLSSLIGVSIFPHQLNVVKFKPKVIQDRKTMSAQKNVTFVDETSNKKSSAASQPQQPRNSSFRANAKPSLQKILPKPLSTPDRGSTLVRKTTETSKLTPSAASRLAVTSSKLNAALTSPMSYGSSAYRYGPAGDASKFEHFSDTKVVKTKEGPKKQLKRKDEPVDNEVKTVYDLVQNVFEQMPSWNLHIIPDTNSFCIAQVSRGRMGIPILKKSIELSAEFSAKVYVHQLHCKKYDGVYDTESKILSLIREIDALAA